MTTTQAAAFFPCYMYRTSNAQIAERPAIWLLMQTSIDAIRHVTETFLGRSSSSECLIKTGVMFNLRHVCQDGIRARSRQVPAACCTGSELLGLRDLWDVVSDTATSTDAMVDPLSPRARQWRRQWHLRQLAKGIGITGCPSNLHGLRRPGAQK